MMAGDENDENTNGNIMIQKKPPVPRMKRPMTANVKLTNNCMKPLSKKKKTDPVSRYQNMQNEWQKNHFLKTGNNKQGRKLELDRFHKWSSLVHAINNQN
jgi:hypothetical protein